MGITVKKGWDIDDCPQIATVEPTMKCPDCGCECNAEFIDNGFGPYAVQASPFKCWACGWVQEGCPNGQDPTNCERCRSWDRCYSLVTPGDDPEA